MVALAVGNFTRDDWSSLISGLGDSSLLQSWEYGEAKARTGPWRVERGVFREDGRVVGVVQALVRRLWGGLPGGLAWINRGPLGGPAVGGAPDAGPLLAMMAEVRRHFADERRLYLRLAPPVAAGALSADDVRRAGYAPTETPGWASAVLDLTPPLESLRDGLRQNWRNGLNKAERLDLEVAHGCDEARFAAFLASHRRLLARRRFATTVTADLLRALQELLPPERKLETFLARREGEVVGTALIAKYGDTAEYLAGALEDEGRRLNAGQLLLWRAVAAMKAEGFRRLDLGGMDAEATPPGIFEFKAGLGGVPYRLAAEIEAGGDGLLGQLVRWRVRGDRRAAGAAAPATAR